MKKQIILFLFLLAISPFAVANTIYLSSTGSDANNGSSESKAVKTLSMALTLAKDNDAVQVLNMIDLTQEPNPQGSLDDINVNGTSTYSSYNTWNAAGTQGVKLLNRRITLRGGDNAACGFDGKGKTRLLNIYASENVTLENLTFINGAADKGAAFFITKENDDDKQLHFNIKNCIVRDNIAENDGGAIYFMDKLGKRHNIRIESSAFIGNKANSWNGGAFYIDNSVENSTLETTIINTTVYGNQAKVGGGAFYYNRGRVGSKLNLVNCTFTGNTIVTDNTGLCPGIFFNSEDNSGESPVTTKNVVKSIYNTIIENNHIAGKPESVMDMSFASYSPKNGTDLFMHNSFVGKVSARRSYTSPVADQNFVGYGRNLSGLTDDPATYIASQKSIPLYEKAAALDWGNSGYLIQYNIHTDQLGNKRSFKNNRCAAGAMEATVKRQITGEPTSYQHFILSGQSLSTGYQSWPPLSVQSMPDNYMIGGQVWINTGNAEKDAFNPLYSNIAVGFRGGEVKSRGAGCNAETPITGMVNHLQLKTRDTKYNTDMIASSVGYGGASIEELSKESHTRDHYTDFLYSLLFGSKIAAETNSSLHVPAIVYMQGEFNYDPNPEKGFLPGVPNATDKASYKKNLVNLKNNMQSDVHRYYGQKDKPVFIVYQTGAQYMRDTISISMAQLEVSNEEKDVICAGPIYHMTDRGGHLDSNGYRWYGEILAKVYYKTQILKEEFKPLQPKEISRGKQANQLVLKYHVPKPPMVLDVQTVPKIKDYGFGVFLNQQSDQNRQTITDIAIEGDNVILTCEKPLTGKVIVSYAGSTARIDQRIEGKNELQGHGNLRDSDDYPAYFTYIDLDKKDEYGAYFYDREKDETTLRPDFEPKDENGQEIYNKPYPLYNFGVAFYYTLNAGKDKLIVPGFE